MLVSSQGVVNSPACSWYIPGLPKVASARSIGAGSHGAGTGEATVSLRRHSVSSARIGSPAAPPSTAAVIAPIEMPATATGRNPGRDS